MLLIWFAGVVLGLIAAVAFVLSYEQQDRLKAIVPIAAVMALASIGVGFAAYPIAHAATQGNAVGGFHQYLDTNVVSSTLDVVECTKDGPCVHEDTSCDPEEHSEPVYDSQGRQTGTRTWTEYHDCPFMTHEYVYTLVDEFGNKYVVGDHWFAENPQEWNSWGIYVNRSGAESVARGVPEHWQEARNAIAAGRAPPATFPGEYENILLGIEDDEYRARSFDIERLKAAGLLPHYTANLFDGNYGIHDDFIADKMLFVGMDRPANYEVWQDRLMQVNAPLGMRKHGDMHIVAIPAKVLHGKVTPEAYIRALKAYWQSREEFGKFGLPKNVLMIVLAVDDTGKTIEWARAETGMPGRNNGAMRDLLMYRLAGQPFDPDAILGSIPAKVVRNGENLTVDYGLKDRVPTAVIPRVILHDEPFFRECMNCDDAGEEGQRGYTDLKDYIPVSGLAIFVSILVQTIIAALLFGAAVWLYRELTGRNPRYLGSDFRPTSSFHF